jgi:hypothetical protein
MGDHRLGSAKQRDYENQRGGNDERPSQLGALIAGGVLLEITDVCPGPGGSDYDATNVSPTQSPALPSTAILLLSHANAPNMSPEAGSLSSSWWRRIEG